MAKLFRLRRHSGIQEARLASSWYTDHHLVYLLHPLEPTYDSEDMGMIEQIRRLANRENHDDEEDGERTRLLPLWAVAAQLVLATGAGATLEHLSEVDSDDFDSVPKGLAWAPLLIAPLSAAANLAHARRPTQRSETAMRFLTGATIGFGAALFAFDVAANRDRAARRLAPLAFASAGVLGLLIDREEREIRETEYALEKRAQIIERLVPKRRTKFDRLVVHV